MRPAEALAELRAQLDAAAGDDPSKVAEALSSTAESAQRLAERLKETENSS